MGFDSKRKIAPPTVLLGLSFALGHGVSPHSHSSAYHLTGVSLTLDMGYLLTAPAPEFGWGGGIFSHSLLLTLDVGYLLTARIPDLVCGLSLLAAPVPHSCCSVICKLEP